MPATITSIEELERCACGSGKKYDDCCRKIAGRCPQPDDPGRTDAQRDAIMRDRRAMRWSPHHTGGLNRRRRGRGVHGSGRWGRKRIHFLEFSCILP